MTNPELWGICATSGCDPRTVAKVWAGEWVQESSGVRVWHALKAAGLIRADAPQPTPPSIPPLNQLQDKVNAKSDKNILPPVTPVT